MLELGKKCIYLDDIMLDFTRKLMKTASQDTKNEVNNTPLHTLSASSASDASSSFIEMSKLCKSSQVKVILLDSSGNNPILAERIVTDYERIDYPSDKNLKNLPNTSDMKGVKSRGNVIL